MGGMGGKSRRRRWKLEPAEGLTDPATAPAVIEAMRRGGRQGFSAFAWVAGWGSGRGGAQAFARVVEQYRRAPSLTVAALPVGERAELRASLSRWGGRELVHLRTWYQPTSGGRWRPTRRGVTLAPEQLDWLEAAALALREAYATGVLGPPPASAAEGAISRPPSASDGPAKPDTPTPA